MSAAIDATNSLAWRRQTTAFSYRNAATIFPAENAMLVALGGQLSRASILDIGIGTGRTTGFLAPRCAAYTGVDYSPEMIERARGRYPAADLRVADARDLGSIGAAAVDIVVFSYNGIDYVDHQDRLRILEQIHHVLRPNGAFLFSAHRLGVAIPRSTDLSNLALSMNPLRAANGLLKYLQGIGHARRLRPLQRREAEYAVLNDAAQQYQLLTYYISPDAQTRQLEHAGFGQVRAFAQNGDELTKAQLTGAAPASLASDYMIHYMALRA